MTWTRVRNSAAVASAVLLLGLSPAAGSTAVANSADPPGIVLPDGCAEGAPAQLDKPALRCLAEAARSSSTGAVVVTLTRPLGLVGLDAGDVRAAQKAFAGGRFAVVLPSGNSGVGGSLLFTLAADPSSRVVARDSSVARLDPATVTLLRSAGSCTEICELLGAAPPEGLPGGRLVTDRHAQENGAVLMLPTRNSGGGDGGVPAWTLVLPVLALAVVLALAMPVRRRLAAQRAYGGRPEAHTAAATLTSAGTSTGTSVATVATAATPATPPPPTRPTAGPQSAGPQSARAASPRAASPRAAPAARPGGPTRTATVRTTLHPQGYVELDRCLVRATWADTGEPPAVGESVETFAAESGSLLAVRASSRRGKN